MLKLVLCATVLFGSIGAYAGDRLDCLRVISTQVSDDKIYINDEIYVYNKESNAIALARIVGDPEMMVCVKESLFPGFKDLVSVRPVPQPVYIPAPVQVPPSPYYGR